MRRNRFQILSTILETCMDGANKTRVVYQSNLNFRTVNPYLDQLVDRDLIQIVPEKPILYKTTNKGAEMLRDFNKVYDALGELR